MYGLIKALIEEYFGTPTYQICILGPERAGKTLLFNSLKYMQAGEKSQRKTEYKPTVGLNVLKYNSKGDKFKIWDLGGRANLRKIWESYYPECHGLIFIIDHRIEEGIEILNGVLTHQEMARIPVLVLGTVPGARQKVQRQLQDPKNLHMMEDRKYAISQLQLQNIPKSQLILKDLLHWLYLQIRQLHNSVKQ